MKPSRTLKTSLSAALLCVTITAIADDLTTVDGKLYKDVTAVNTNYLPTVIVTYKEGRAGLKLTNLPAAFRSKFGLPEPPAPPTNQPSSNQPAAINQLLAWYGQSDIHTEKSVDWSPTNDAAHLNYTMVIRVSTMGFELTAYKAWDSGKGADYKREFSYDASTTFRHGQEALASRVFGKFLEWESVAAKTNAEAFEKPITSIPDSDSILGPMTRSFKFKWNPDAYLRSDSDDTRGWLMDSHPVTSIFHKAEVLGFQDLLKTLPQLKEELLAKLQNKDAQKNLFR